MNQRIFVTGIGTGVGKTIVSAVLIDLLDGEYWKPIQAGDLESSDSIKIHQLLGDGVKIHPESYRLKHAASPHWAAEQERLNIELAQIKVPNHVKPLVIEGAGGLLVPINQKNCVVDLVQHFNSAAIIVSKYYLGSINHTLLTYEALLKRGIKLLGIVFNGQEIQGSRETILSMTGLSELFSLPEINCLNRESLRKEIARIRIDWKNNYALNEATF